MNEEEQVSTQPEQAEWLWVYDFLAPEFCIICSEQDSISPTEPVCDL